MKSTITASALAHARTLLAASNGKATTHTATLFDLGRYADEAEHQLASLCIPIKFRVGATFQALSGGTVPAAYKFRRKVTSVKFIRRVSGWSPVWISTIEVWPNQKTGVTLILTPSQDALAVAVFRKGYAVAPTPAPEHTAAIAAHNRLHAALAHARTLLAAV